MPIPRERPPSDDTGYGFDEPLYDESNWWELSPERPLEGGGGPERPSGPSGPAEDAWLDPSGEAGPGGTTWGTRPSPRQTTEASPFAAEVAGFRPTSSRPRPGSFHLQSIEREAEQQARIRTLREAGRPERGKAPPAEPWREKLHPILLAKRAKKERQRKDTLSDLQFQIQEMELKKQMEFADLNRQLTEARLQKAIRQAKEFKKIPKRRKPRPAWGI